MHGNLAENLSITPSSRVYQQWQAMKVHGTLIVRTLRGMAVASLWIPALSNSLRLNQAMALHPTSTRINPQIARLSFRPIIPNTFKFSSATATTNSARRWPKEARTVCSVAGNHVVKANTEYNEDESFLAKDAWKARSGNTTRVVKGSSEHNDDESSRFNYPRPQEVPWQKKLSNTVHFVGKVGLPVQLQHTKSGKACAQTSLAVKNRGGEIMWLPLVFWNELAETAAQHLKLNDIVCVSGFLGLETRAGEDDKLQRFKVIAMTLNFIKNTYPDISEQALVNKMTPFPSFSKQTGKNAEKVAPSIESLWQAFFSCPLEWWDNRTNKRNPKYPDFKHKDTGDVLWIGSKSNPPWVKSQLAVLDSRMKVFEEWEKVGSSARSPGSLSSSQDNGF